MPRNGLNLGLPAGNMSLLDADAIAPAAPVRPVSQSRNLGMGIFAAFVRSRELRRRIKFAAQSQATRLG